MEASQVLRPTATTTRAMKSFQYSVGHHTSVNCAKTNKETFDQSPVRTNHTEQASPLHRSYLLRRRFKINLQEDSPYGMNYPRTTPSGEGLKTRRTNCRVSKTAPVHTESSSRTNVHFSNMNTPNLQSAKVSLDHKNQSEPSENMFRIILGFAQALFRDVIGVFLYFKFQVQFRRVTYYRESVVSIFERISKNYAQKTAINYKEEKVTFDELKQQSNRIANWLETMNIGLSDEFLDKQREKNSSLELEHPQVGLMVGNIPEMPAFLLGAAKVRASSVFFNTNQKRDTLLNAFRATKCKIVIFDAKYLQVLREISASIDPKVRFFMYDRDAISNNNNNFEVVVCGGDNRNLLEDFGSENFSKFNGSSTNELSDSLHTPVNFARILKFYPTTPLKQKYSYSLSDHLGYIFTSGTTGGAIKATPVDNVRYIVGYLSQSNAFGVTANDNIYIPLPLFHSFPGIVGLGRCLLGGSTITLADKFSASGFWSDCVKNQCTVALYIGETCRYLLAQPERPEEQQHQVRMMLGLGMKREIWREFTERFRIKKIAEFYGSSEGNINIFNMCNIQGSCGFIPYYFGPLTRFLFPIYLIHVDPVTLEPIRQSNGLCKLAGPNQTALIVGQIKENLPYTKFLGYTAKEESSKKVIQNILNQGDYGFSSGDLMEMDIYGNLFFRDRTGDTFRWKGENVSTTEIEEIAGVFLKNRVFTIYGVELPHCDGRVGMMAIEGTEQGLDLSELLAHFHKHLPEYSVPKFIRFTPKIETTSTHKVIKYRLREAGIHSDVTNFPHDRVYFCNKQTQQYQTLTPDIYQQIHDSAIQF